MQNSKNQIICKKLDFLLHFEPLSCILENSNGNQQGWILFHNSPTVIDLKVRNPYGKN
jgi:hypothetical protein